MRRLCYLLLAFLPCLTLLLGGVQPALAQSAAISSADSTGPVARAGRTELLPRRLLLQTGSGLGLLALGTGYAFQRDRLEAHGQVGFVPASLAGSLLLIPALKLMYTPYRVRLHRQWQLRPLTLGLYGSYTHGLPNTDRGQYPKGYYWFSNTIRLGPLLGGALRYQWPGERGARPRRLTVFYELGSNDLYLASYFANRNYGSLGLADILTLGLGLKSEF